MMGDFANYDVVISNTACGSITSNTVKVSNCSVTIDVIAALEGTQASNGSHAAFMPLPPGLTRAQLTAVDINGNYIVDYVTVEVRKSGIPGGNTMIQTQQAMIKSNGHIVALDGVSPLTFTGIAAGNYNIAIRHRLDRKSVV